MKSLDLINIVNKYSKNEEYDFNGYLMYKDDVVAEIKNTELIKVLRKDLLPVIMLNESLGSFEVWLQTRVIDTHRTNSRQVRRRLSVKTEVPKEIVIKARAINQLSENVRIYIGERLSYDDEKIIVSSLKDIHRYKNEISKMSSLSVFLFENDDAKCSEIS